MATIRLPQDFQDFLRLLNANNAKYLLIGGYAVGYHGYPRATVDMDIWIDVSEENVLVRTIQEFGFNDPELSVEIFSKQKKTVRMGFPPIRIEVISEIDGVKFDDCYKGRIVGEIGGVQINIIDLENLKKNKKASGRLKDLTDLEYLP